ncbi:MAG TPA: aminotransferase class V-fold PLP-dependent enzyme, partial [Pirellulales bacterium]
PPIVPAIGLGAAIDYLERIGLESIAAHEQLLTRRAIETLSAIEGVRILGPSLNRIQDPRTTDNEQRTPSHAGIVSFVVDGIHAHDVAQLLDRHGIAIRAGHHCAMPLHKRLGINATSRASFYFYNTPAEIDAMGEALRDAKKIFRRG